MAVPVIVSSTANSGRTTVKSVSPPASLAEGDLWLIAGAAHLSSRLTPTPSGFTLAARDNSTDASAAIYWKIAGASESAVNVTIEAGTSSDYALWSIRVTGAHRSSPIHQTVVELFSASTSHAINAFTTTLADCLGMYLLGKVDAASIPLSIAGTGWTETAENDFGTTPDGIAVSFGSKSLAAAGSSGIATVASATSSVATGIQIAIVRGLNVANVNGVIPASINGKTVGQPQLNSVLL